MTHEMQNQIAIKLDQLQSKFHEGGVHVAEPMKHLELFLGSLDVRRPVDCTVNLVQCRGCMNCSITYDTLYECVIGKATVYDTMLIVSAVLECDKEPSYDLYCKTVSRLTGNPGTFINPTSGRPCKIGGSLHKQLQRNGKVNKYGGILKEGHTHAWFNDDYMRTVIEGADVSRVVNHQLETSFKANLGPRVGSSNMCSYVCLRVVDPMNNGGISEVYFNPRWCQMHYDYHLWALETTLQQATAQYPIIAYIHIDMGRMD
jgi:hypothetical protein